VSVGLETRRARLKMLSPRKELAVTKSLDNYQIHGKKALKGFLGGTWGQDVRLGLRQDPFGR